MIASSLNGLSKMKKTMEVDWIDGMVPGSVYSELQKSTKIIYIS